MEGETSAACDESDDDNGRKWHGDKTTPVNVPWVPIEKLSHTFPKSAVQVKALLNSINLCNHSAWKLPEVSASMRGKGFWGGAAPHAVPEGPASPSRTYGAATGWEGRKNLDRA